MLAVMGKDPLAPEGIVTLVQLDSALAALQQAVMLDHMTHKPGSAWQDERDEDGDARPERVVHFAQRALPLVEMLKRSIKEQKPVTWRASGSRVSR